MYMDSTLLIKINLKNPHNYSTVRHQSQKTKLTKSTNPSPYDRLRIT